MSDEKRPIMCYVYVSVVEYNYLNVIHVCGVQSEKLSVSVLIVFLRVQHHSLICVLYGNIISN